jgi:hypothetical protein
LPCPHPLVEHPSQQKTQGARLRPGQHTRPCGGVPWQNLPDELLTPSAGGGRAAVAAGPSPAVRQVRRSAAWLCGGGATRGGYPCDSNAAARGLAELCASAATVPRAVLCCPAPRVSTALGHQGHQSTAPEAAWMLTLAQKLPAFCMDSASVPLQRCPVLGLRSLNCQCAHFYYLPLGAQPPQPEPD